MMEEALLLHLFQSALPRGERQWNQGLAGPVRYFNPRSREGSDGRHYRSICQRRNFNPRSREGSDERFVRMQCSLRNFNPRSREGSDYDITKALLYMRISIRAPARGATYLFRQNSIFSGFQSALPRGERRYHQNFL